MVLWDLDTTDVYLAYMVDSLLIMNEGDCDVISG